MLTGHAFSRALRANILAGAALRCVLLETPGCMDNVNKDHLRNLYTTLLDKEQNSTDNTDIAEEECIKKLTNITSQLLDQAAINSRTGKLWVQYRRQVSLLQLFIRAERTGSWALHLHCVREMIPHFHAAGHRSTLCKICTVVPATD